MANLNIKTALTGGTINCVDRNSAGMKVEGSICLACISGSPNVLRIYKFFAASTDTADGNVVIIPYGQSGGTAGRWILQGKMRADDNISGNANTANTAYSVWNGTGGGEFLYAPQSGSPAYVWGTNDGLNYYVWEPSDMGVLTAVYAEYAEYADWADAIPSTPRGLYTYCVFYTDDQNYFVGNNYTLGGRSGTWKCMDVQATYNSEYISTFLRIA